MNTDVLKGKWNEVKGELKKRWGQLTDDDLQQTEGDFDKLVGQIQQRYGYAKERAQRELKEVFDHYERSTRPV